MMPDDPRKRPLLTPEQLRVISRGQQRPRKLSPREEFEKLFQKRDSAALGGVESAAAGEAN
jgi:hypothetical protein